MKQRFGCDPEKWDGPSIGGHIHIGRTYWRQMWHNFKQTLIFGWPTFLKEYGLWMMKEWKLMLLIALGCLAVKYGSQLAGYLSVYIY